MTITKEQLNAYRLDMIENEIAPSTIQRYMSIAESLARWIGERPMSKELLVEWRAQLTQSVGSVNIAVAAVNRLLVLIGCEKCRLKHLKTQSTVFRPVDKELTREEYERLVETAEQLGKQRLARAIETICVLGIRVSELKFLTVETLDSRAVTVRNKGKTRTILISAELAKKLRIYCRQAGIETGPVFITRTGKTLRRTQLWAEMKWLCRLAKVEAGKVFPHNLRHLFAVTHYRLHKDIVRLADLLGHSSVNTTRIYLKTSGLEHQRELDAMGLVLPAKWA